MVAGQRLTGIGSNSEAPVHVELTLDTSHEIERMLTKTGVLFEELADHAAKI